MNKLIAIAILFATTFPVNSNTLDECNSVIRTNRTDSIIMQSRFSIAREDPSDVEANKSSVTAILSFRKSGYDLVEKCDGIMSPSDMANFKARLKAVDDLLKNNTIKTQ